MPHSSACRRTHARRWAACALGALYFLAAPLYAEPVTIDYRGLRLNGELLEPVGARPPLVLLVHGILSHHRMPLIASMQKLLAERGHGSLAITLSLGVDRRTGNYDCAVPHDHTVSDALDEIDAWLVWLRARGVTRVALLGHSHGGNQVARFAAERKRDAVVAVVLLAPGTWTAEGAAERYQARNGIAIDSARAKARAQPPEAWIEGLPLLHCGAVKVRARSFLNYHDADPRLDTPSLLPQIVLPTLVIAGSVDTNVPDVALRTRPYVDADTRLVVIAGADHFFLDFLGEDAADAIVKFLRGPY